MITEDYVSFETAKLLKEKGFDGKCKKYYNLKMLTNPYYGCEYVRNRNLKDENDCIAPTLQMAMKWLREVHNLEIYPYHQYSEECCKWWFEIVKFPSLVSEYESNTIYPTYEEAVEAAIKYCLENLI